MKASETEQRAQWPTYVHLQDLIRDKMGGVMMVLENWLIMWRKIKQDLCLTRHTEMGSRQSKVLGWQNDQVNVGKYFCDLRASKDFSNKNS